MPVLVVYGTGDTVFPDVGWDKLVAPHANIEYLPIEGAEHGAAMGAALTQIKSFLDRATPT